MDFILFFQNNLCCLFVLASVCQLLFAALSHESCLFFAQVYLSMSIVQSYAFYMGGEGFYFQFFRNVLTFEEIFEDVVIRGHQYFSLHYVCYGVES